MLKEENPFFLISKFFQSNQQMDFFNNTILFLLKTVYPIPTNIHLYLFL